MSNICFDNRQISVINIVANFTKYTMDINGKIERFLEESKESDKKPLLVILGATASGKTDLSIEIAKKYNGEIISADSRQVYRYMDIATAKIRENETENIPHYMIDIIDPDQEFTLADFVDRAKKHINDISKRNKLPILIGGTGLYIRAICENYQIPSVPPDYELRKKLENEIIEKGEDYVYEKLKKLDPESAEKIHPHNHRYVIRAIEICLNKDLKNTNSNNHNYNILKIGIDWTREKLYERINERARNQIEEGLINETKTLLNNGYDAALPSMSSLGYPEMIKYIKGEWSLEDAILELQKNTRNYAKRQLTWFRREPDVNWIMKG
jgi:tRNA dimethylallyltransferase